MSYNGFPRGDGSATDRDLATGRFQRLHEIELLAYQKKGALFIGATPPANRHAELNTDHEQAEHELSRIVASDRPIDERIDAVKQLDAAYRANLLHNALPVSWHDDRNALLISAPGGGKGTDSIVPQLVSYGGSMIICDPKAENAQLTYARRGDGLHDEKNNIPGIGQTIDVFDPFGIADVPSEYKSSLNVLSLIDKNSPNAVLQAGVIAEGLMIPGRNRGADHFDAQAQALIEAVLLHLITTYKNPSLIDLRHFLTQGNVVGYATAWKEVHPDRKAKMSAEAMQFHDDNPNPRIFLLNRMAENDAFDGVISGCAETILAMGHEERGGVYSTAARNTKFLDLRTDSFREALTSTKRVIDLSAYKTDPKGRTLYLCLPAQRMAQYGRLLRVIIGMMLEEMYKDLTPPAAGAQTLFLLDEFATAIGYMSSIEQAAAYARGYGVKMQFVVQSLQQLKTHYKDSYGTIIESCGVIQAFAVDDPETTKYLSTRMGECEVRVHTESRTINDQFGTGKPSDVQRAGGVLGGRGALLRTVGEMVFSAETENESLTISDSRSESIQVVPLMRADEIARHFSKESGSQLVLIKGQLPLSALRVHYYDSPWFRDLVVKRQPRRRLADGTGEPLLLRAIRSTKALPEAGR